MHTHRFFDLISESLTPSDASPHSLSDVLDEDIQYKYELENSGERVLLGRGSFGVVYSAIDLVTEKKMAVKEITINEATDSG